MAEVIYNNYKTYLRYLIHNLFKLCRLVKNNYKIETYLQRKQKRDNYLNNKKIVNNDNYFNFNFYVSLNMFHVTHTFITSFF